MLLIQCMQGLIRKNWRKESAITRKALAQKWITILCWKAIGIQYFVSEVGEGGYLIVKTAAGEFTYQVNKVRIGDDMDKTVIVPIEETRLILIACYPLNFIENAPKRYVLVAELINLAAYQTSEPLYLHCFCFNLV
ncbi:sortase domain-containing protein [Planococcus lenghuensis]|uniref:Sortase n=1 Tax=Planococcus lenghuensis TaxID=2213202 RepID=A0A1Q2KYL5_9BACL|nr:hypothetical protein B0X71_09140 [Planococcus lenghuensis]